MFTNFQRKNMMSRGGRNDCRRWPVDGGQYNEFEENERYDRDKRFRQQQSFRYQSDHRDSHEQWNNYDPNARHRHDQYRQHPPRQSWGFDRSYDSRKRTYHDNKENKNHPNNPRYSSPKKNINHDRTWSSSNQRRAHSPPGIGRNYRSRSPVSSHSRKKRRIKENRGDSKSPSSKRDSPSKGNAFQNDRRTMDEARKGEKVYKVDHRKSKCTSVTGRFQYKKKYFNSYISNRSRFTWSKTGNRRGKGVTIGNLTIPPISSDEFNHRSEEVVSKGDIEEEINDLEEGEICTDDKVKKKSREKQKREKSVKGDRKQERKGQCDNSEIKNVADSNLGSDEYIQSPDKDLVEKERQSYEEDTCKFFNRVTSEKVKGASEYKVADCKSEANCTIQKDIDSNEEMSPISSELAQEENQPVNSTNAKIFQIDIKNTGNEKTDTESLSVAGKVKVVKQGKRKSVDKLEETLRLTNSTVICGSDMIQKIVSLASKSLAENDPELENEINNHCPKRELTPQEKEKIETTNACETKIKLGEEKSTCIGSVQNFLKSTVIEPSVAYGKPNKVSELKEKERNMLKESSVQLKNDNFELISVKSTKCLQHEDNEGYGKLDCVEQNVMESIKGKVVQTNYSNLNKKENNCKNETFSSSSGKPTTTEVTINCNELKRNQDERKASESFSSTVCTRPVTPPPYSSQSSQQNEGYYFSGGSLINRSTENLSPSIRPNFVGSKYETKKDSGSDQFENISKISTSKDVNENSSYSSCNLNKPLKNNDAKDTYALIHSSSVFKSRCKDSKKEPFLEKRVTVTTTADTGRIKENSRKRHGSEPSIPAVIRGRKNRPSDGIFYPLGKPPDKKRKIVKTFSTEQPLQSHIFSDEHNQENTETLSVQTVTAQESVTKGLEKVDSVQTNLFNKNKRRISHFNRIKTIPRQHKTTPNEVKQYISGMSNNEEGQRSKRSTDNIFDKMIGIESVKDAETDFQTNANTSLVNEKDVNRKLHKDNVQKDLIVRNINASNSIETEGSNLTREIENSKNVADIDYIDEKQGTDKENVINTETQKKAHTISETQMMSSNHNENCKTFKEVTNQRNINIIDEINETKNGIINETNKMLSKENFDQIKTIPISIDENITVQKGKQNQIHSDLEEKLHGHIENERKPLEMGIDIVSKYSLRVNDSDTQKAYYEESSEFTKTKETGPALNEHALELNQNESEDEDDMEDIEPIEMIGSVFMNDISMNDDDTESSSLNKYDIEMSGGDLKIDYCDDSILLQNTCLENLPYNLEICNNDKENENTNDIESGEKYKISLPKNGVWKENSCEIDDAYCTKNNFEGKVVTEIEGNIHEEKLIKFTNRRLVNTERKRFSAKLETLGKLIDDEKTNENNDSLINTKTKPTEMNDSKSNKKNLKYQTENSIKTKSTEWLKLARTNMQSLVRVKTQVREQSELSSQEENDANDEDLPSVRSLLQWDFHKPTLQSSTLDMQQFSSPMTSVFQREPISMSPVSKESLKPATSKVKDKTLSDSLSKENHITATLTDSNCNEDNYTNDGSFLDKPAQNISDITHLQKENNQRSTSKYMCSVQHRTEKHVKTNVENHQNQTREKQAKQSQQIQDTQTQGKQKTRPKRKQEKQTQGKQHNQAQGKQHKQNKEKQKNLSEGLKENVTQGKEETRIEGKQGTRTSGKQEIQTQHNQTKGKQFKQTKEKRVTQPKGKEETRTKTKQETQSQGTQSQGKQEMQIQEKLSNQTERKQHHHIQEKLETRETKENRTQGQQESRTKGKQETRTQEKQETRTKETPTNQTQGKHDNQTQEKQGNKQITHGNHDHQLSLKTSLPQSQSVDQSTAKKATNKQNPNLQNNKHGAHDMPEQSMTKQSYNVGAKNVTALPSNIANIPMFNQLTVPLMDIDHDPSNKEGQTYASTNTKNNNSTTMSSVSQKSQSKRVDVFGSEEIGSQDTVTCGVNTAYYSLACAQVEMPGVCEPVRRNTSTSTRQQAMIMEENQTRANVQTFETQLIAEVTKEEKRRQLYRELCDLDGINTGDFGLDIILLAKKSHIRGLSFVNREVLQLVKGRDVNDAHQQGPQEQTLQLSKEHLNIEERIHHLANLKQNHR